MKNKHHEVGSGSHNKQPTCQEVETGGFLDHTLANDHVCHIVEPVIGTDSRRWEKYSSMAEGQKIGNWLITASSLQLSFSMALPMLFSATTSTLSFKPFSQFLNCCHYLSTFPVAILPHLPTPTFL